MASIFEDDNSEYVALEALFQQAFEGYDKGLTGEAAALEITTRAKTALTAACKAAGQDPAWEVHSWTPASDAQQGRCWGVSWEAGPYQWAIAASFLIMDLTGRLVEPYYSFDLCFYEVE